METDRPWDALTYYERYRNEEIIKYMPYRPGLRVLECRCGKGVLLDQLSGRTAAAWGVDLSLPTLRAGLKPAQVVLAQDTCLPFESCSFDVVTADGVLGNAPASARLLGELARVLCPGGRLILWERRGQARASGLSLLDFASAGLLLLCEEPFDYFTYPTAASINRVPRLRRGRPAHALIKLMFALDSLLERVPLVRIRNWHRILVARKGGPADDGSTDP